MRHTSVDRDSSGPKGSSESSGGLRFLSAGKLVIAITNIDVPDQDKQNGRGSWRKQTVGKIGREDAIIVNPAIFKTRVDANASLADADWLTAAGREG
jgi:hypothetical protein